ncbi:hypothetical protein E6A55_16865 [Cupriavidus necator H16]|uniref:Uncharacterized protein n=1 Tax=Cupriavidus necator (strain ATCC 17699 / DSM 428 / KCTC 22496 / NCIMB 10442 / H16 / Stanier 337) TaxID=381666 RepID=A0AAE5ZFV7_CUPNH|nr:hypothetical protein [Cupriavidus necator]QCC02132.1 hypothetical protein E6A55_16865 [Cupriavidus necator H16]QQB78462.1 hypothetical protein I6H87_09290 [Cupriavidus necator]
MTKLLQGARIRPNIRPLATHNAALQSRRSKGCGVDRDGWRSEVGALAAAKKDAETVDETKKALHNLVSLLQTTQRR